MDPANHETGCPIIDRAIGVDASARPGRAFEAVKPNIVFFLADDLGFMDIGANNPGTFYETPNIDRLAARGMRFTQGHSSCPVCSPTRASLMTGKYPPRTGVTDYISGVGTRRASWPPLPTRTTSRSRR